MNKIRYAAAQRGETHFFGEPCKHGHDGYRYVLTNRCVMCERDSARMKYEANKRIISEARLKAKQETSREIDASQLGNNAALQGAPPPLD